MTNLCRRIRQPQIKSLIQINISSDYSCKFKLHFRSHIAGGEGKYVRLYCLTQSYGTPEEVSYSHSPSLYYTSPSWSEDDYLQEFD